jgi:hypothetical protein
MSEALTLLRWIKRTSDLSLVHERLSRGTTPRFCADEWVMLGNAKRLGGVFAIQLWGVNGATIRWGRYS